jgi:NitT/TauT family transport system substrate-binding protein
MRNKNRLIPVLAVLLAISVLVLAVAGCGGTTTTTAAPATTATTAAPSASTTSAPPASTTTTAGAPTNLHLLVCIPVPTLAVYYVNCPDKLGYYKQENLNVTTDYVDSSTLVIQQLAAGKADVGLVISGPLVSAWSQGTNLIAVGDPQTHAIFSLIVPAGSPIKSYADLKGKTVGIKEATGGDLPSLNAELAKAGVTLGQNTQTEVVGNDWPTIFAKFKSGEIAAYNASFNDLFGIQTNPAYAYVVIDPPPDPNTPQLYVPFAMTPDFVNNHQQAAIGFLRAVTETLVFGHTNPDAILAIQAQAFPPEVQDPAYAKAAMKVANEYTTPLGSNPWLFMSVEGAQQQINQMVNPGQPNGLEKSFDPAPYMNLNLFPEANKFDQQAVIQQANSSTLTYPPATETP